MTLNERIIELVPDIVQKTVTVKESGQQIDMVRPITLADVLRAIDIEAHDANFILKSDGNMYLPYVAEEAGDMYWNLTTDLDGQSPETKAFISKILGV